MEREFILKFSAIEIYNESVRDLLSPDCTPLRLLDDPEVNKVDYHFLKGLVSMRAFLLMVCVNFDSEEQLLRNLLRKLLGIGNILQNSFLFVKVRRV